MDTPPTNGPSGDSPQPAAIDLVCREFEHETSGSRIEDCLHRLPDDSRRAAFRRLLAIELTHRCQSGETPEPAEYRQRFPEFCAEVDFEFQQLPLPEHNESHSVSLDRTVSRHGSSVPHAGNRQPQPGDSVGRYRLERLVGGGGFGFVWRAFDPELNRPVAIKLARSDKAISPTILDQTRDEARKAAKVTHRGIVPVYDVVPCEGSLGIVSEYIDGPTLAARLTAGKLPVDEALDIITQVAEALHHAHLHNLVHRDVKPGNILLRKNGNAVLTDFGLAVSEEELLRERGGIVGTRSHMSPEQARGESNRVDSRTDVYSLGVVFYQLLTGRLPYVAGSSAEYRDQILHRDPRPPRTVDDAIDPELERICLRCLEKSLGARHATCDALVRELREFRSRSSPPMPMQLPRRSKAVRWLPVAALALVFAAIAATVDWSGSAPEPNPPDNPTSDRPQPSKSANGVNDGAENRIRKTVKVDPLAWQSLLDKPPTIICWPRIDGRRVKPTFDADLKQYSVRSDNSRWISKLGNAPSDRIEIATILELKDWIGQAGIIWALRTDKEAVPRNQQLCLCVEFENHGPPSPPQLVIRKLTLVEREVADMRERSNAPLDSVPVKIPQKTTATLKIRVENGRVLVEFNGRVKWEAKSRDLRAAWPPAGTMGIGISAIAGDARFTGFSVRTVPRITRPGTQP